MALKLTTQQRWCVSGTPVGRGKLEDLYGLLLFLRVLPFSSKIWFAKCMCPSYGQVDDRISHLLRRLFWRSTKNFPLVLEQMGVPEQVERKFFLRASSIEKHFYDRQVGICWPTFALGAQCSRLLDSLTRCTLLSLSVGTDAVDGR
jgi:E3 ubiquitin-protein ligase SHPRH